MANITRKGEKRYLIRIFLGRKDGKIQWHSEFFKGTRPEAMKRAAEIEASLKQGTYVKKSGRTLDEYLDEWLGAIRSRLAVRTHRDYTDLMRRYVRPELGGMLLQEIEDLDIVRLYSGMERKGLSPRVVRYTHTVLAMALKKAVRWTLIRFNPTAQAELPKRKRREFAVFNAEEAQAFILAAKTDSNYAILLLALDSGMRPEEYFGLMWDDFDFKAGTVTCRRVLCWRTKAEGGGWYTKEPKTNLSRRTLRLSPGTMTALKAHKKQQAEMRLKQGKDWQEYGFICTTRYGTPMLLTNFHHYHFKPTLERAGFDRKKYRLYDLRHTCATLLLADGENAKVVSERLGHSSIVLTLDTYTHVLPSMQQGASDRLSRILYGEG